MLASEARSTADIFIKQLVLDGKCGALHKNDSHPQTTFAFRQIASNAHLLSMRRYWSVENSGSVLWSVRKCRRSPLRRGCPEGISRNNCPNPSEYVTMEFKCVLNSKWKPRSDKTSRCKRFLTNHHTELLGFRSDSFESLSPFPLRTSACLFESFSDFVQKFSVPLFDLRSLRGLFDCGGGDLVSTAARRGAGVIV